MGSTQKYTTHSLETEDRSEKIHGQVLKIPFSTFGRITVSLPLGSLIFCFVTAVIFKFNEVNKTVCNAQNFVPSISAITGVTPQRYVWRVCIALHSTPRFALGFMYYNYYLSRVKHIEESQQGWFKFLVKVNFWCYTIENTCLVLVTYIANVENYPVHEKVFVVFMITSIVYELMTVVLFRWAHPEMETLPRIMKSYRMKKMYFTLILLFSAGLLYFFLRHRWFCEPNAFSWFSSFEYGIAIVNILFHYTAQFEFAGLNWYVGLPSGVTPAADIREPDIKEAAITGYQPNNGTTNHHKRE